MEQDGFSFVASVSAARTGGAVSATIQHYGQTEEAFRNVTSGASFYRRGPSPFVCPRSDNHCNPHKGNSKKRSFGDLHGVGGPPARRGGGVWGGSADRVFREGAIADIILFACGLWERSQSGGVKGGGLEQGEQCKDSSSVRKVHRLVLTEFSPL